MSWINDNYKWIFDGFGVVLIGTFFSIFIKKRIGTNAGANNTNKIDNRFVINNNINNSQERQNSETIPISADKEDHLKKITNILFIDDDTKFKVVNILRRSGWVNTKMLKDINSLNEDDVKKAHIFFVDIKGVGSALGCNDEGLGLAVILKKEFPNKKLVIYSTENQGERFHAGMRVADDILSKNAEPYEFLHLVDQYSKEIFSN